MKNIIVTAFLFAVIASVSCSSRKLTFSSPDGNLKVGIIPGGTDSTVASFLLTAGKRKVLLPSTLRLSANTGKATKTRLIRFEEESINNTWVNNLGERKNVPDIYNSLKLYLMRDGIAVNVIFRAYNEGIAVSWEIPSQEGIDTVIIKEEKILYRFQSDYMAWSAPRAQAQYRHVNLSRIDKGCERPLVIEYDSTLTVALGEAALIDFPRMKFEPDSSAGAGVRSRLEGEAAIKLPFRSPWRFVMAGKNAGELLEKNYMILNLNDPCEINDPSWILPGKVLREVTLTTSGGKSAIDFTSSHGMQYVEFDAGWYGPENNDASDAKAVNLDPARSKGPLDMKEVIDYAHSKGIRILLYVNRRALEKQLDELLPVYNAWGISGLKFGFVQVGSQKATSWLHESITKAAAYKMVVDVHDEYRPTGFSRTYPNFLTQEGIRGDEESPSNSHTLVTMFTRMLAGPGDNTICYYNERVDKKMGSHASQLAKSVCLFSPLQFLYWYDRASNIGNEPELEFFNEVPTVWDETKVLHACIGEYGVIARRKGDSWFIGGINGNSDRNLDISFSFLAEGEKYLAKIYSDDPSVNTVTHVRTDSLEVNSTMLWTAKLKANNGFAMQVRKME